MSDRRVFFSLVIFEKVKGKAKGKVVHSLCLLNDIFCF